MSAQKGYAVLLNPPNSCDTGSIHVHVRPEKSGVRKKEWWIEGEFRVKDCTRAVVLSLYCDSASSYKQRLKKLQKIERAAKRAQELLIEAHQRATS